MSALITVDRARQAISRTQWPQSELDRVATLVIVASAACQKHCRREFLRGQRHLILPWSGNPLWLPHPPVHQVTSVLRWPDDSPVGYQTTLPAGWIQLNLDPPRSHWHDPYQSIESGIRVRVAYESGFDPIPEDIQEAVALWTASLYWQSRQDPTVSPVGPPQPVVQLLAPYRRLLLP